MSKKALWIDHSAAENDENLSLERHHTKTMNPEKTYSNSEGGSKAPETARLGPVLVVDDDPDIRVVLGEILEEEGFDVQVASNGLEALKLLKTHKKPALILLDLMMPVMDGHEFRSEQLKDEGLAKIPVIVITAGRRSEGDVSGFDATILKPIDLPTLISTIKKYC